MKPLHAVIRNSCTQYYYLLRGSSTVRLATRLKCKPLCPTIIIRRNDGQPLQHGIKIVQG